MIDYLLGRPIGHWTEIDYVMASHGIRDAKELKERLDYRAVTSKTLTPVYDRLNRKRLLGHFMGIEAAVRSTSSPYLRVAAFPPLRLSAAHPGDLPDVQAHCINLIIDRETKDNGWTFSPVLLTDDPLDLLMRCRDFRLPGENERQFIDRMRGL